MAQQASTPVRSLHKLGLGICLGGTLFGLIALNPTVPYQRQKSARARPQRGLDATLAGLKNLLLVGALVTSVASAIVGMRIARQAPEGDTPVASGTEPAPETPEEAARSQRLSAFLGAATVALVAGVLGLSSALAAPCRELWDGRCSSSRARGVFP